MRVNRVTLATEMARREWRFKRLAEETGLSRATVSAVACGKTVAPDTAQKIANALNMSLKEIVEGEQRNAKIAHNK